MATRFTLPQKPFVDRFTDNVSLGDLVNYEIDCSAWEAANDVIQSAVWTLEHGTATIVDTGETSGVLYARVTYSQSGKVLISILVTTATAKKKIWLEALVKDVTTQADDYGYAA